MFLYKSKFGTIELTRERLKHILTFHPEIKGYQKYFKNAVAKPDFVCFSKSDQKVRILYKKLSRLKFLAIVIKTNSRNFILTSYITKRLK